MDVAALRAYVRTQSRDDGGGAPTPSAGSYLRSDAQILADLNEAQEEAVLRGGLLTVTGSTAFAAPTLVAGTRDYTLDSLVYEVVECYTSTNPTPILAAPLTMARDINTDWLSQTGAPRFFVPDYTAGAISLYPTPDATVAGAALIARHRRLPVALVNDGDEPEIASQHHRRMCDWALYRLFDSHESDLYDPQRALLYLGRFEQHFGTRSSAKIDEIRQQWRGDIRPRMNLDGAASDGWYGKSIF